VLPEPTKDAEPKGSLRIHSPDSANDKIELKRPKMDNFWFKKIKKYIKFYKTFRSLGPHQLQKKCKNLRNEKEQKQ